MIAIIISTAMISAVSTLCASFMELMRNTAIAELGNWHFMITDVPAQDVAALEHSGFDGQIALCRQAKFAQLERVANYNKPYLFILELGPGAELNFPVELTEGRLPYNENEIALPEHLETHGGLRYRIGDTITLETGKRICPKGLCLNYRQLPPCILPIRRRDLYPRNAPDLHSNRDFQKAYLRTFLVGKLHCDYVPGHPGAGAKGHGIGTVPRPQGKPGVV